MGLSLLLALAGGFADAGSYVLAGSFTGHVTGNVLLAVVGAVSQRWPQVVSCLLAVCAFLAGTALGSAWPRQARRNPVRQFSQPLAAELVLVAAGIAAAALRVPAGQRVLILCLCLSLGVQNGMLDKVGSVSIHSTYITGMSTSLVASVAGRRHDRKRQLLPAVIGCFLAGAACGAYLVSRVGLIGFGGILLPLALALALAVTAPRSTGAAA